MQIHVFLTLILLGASLRMALHLTYGARGPQPNDGLYHGLNVLSWVLLCGSLLPMSLVVGGGLLGAFVALIISATVIILGLRSLQASREIARRATVRMMGLAAERGLPIGPTVSHSAAVGGGRIRRAALRLAEDLDAGVPFATALERHRGAVPRDTIAYAVAGEAVDDPTAALFETDHEDRIDQLWFATLDRVAYLFAVGLAMLMILTFVMIWIVPEFQKMFYEFDLSLAPMTLTLIGISDWCVNYWFLPAFPICCFFLLLLVLAVMYVIGIPVLRPFLDWLFRSRHQAVVLRALALLVERGRPLADGLLRLAERYPAPSMARRLRRAADDVVVGEAWTVAFERHGLIRGSDRAVLESAQAANNLDWAMRVTADRIERRQSNRWEVLVQIVYPCCILALAAASGFIVIALFIPLVQLIEGLTG